MELLTHCRVEVAGRPFMRGFRFVVVFASLAVVVPATPALAAAQVPTGLQADRTNSVTPRLSGVVSSSTGAPVTGKFFVRTHGSQSTDVVNGALSGVVPSGSRPSFDVAQGQVRIATTYDYWMKTCDSAGVNCSGGSTVRTFTINPQLGAGERRTFTQLTRRLDNDLVAKVNVGSGNLLLEYRGISLPGVSGALGLGLAYNSLQVAGPHPAPATGFGWVPSTMGQRYERASDGSVTVYGPSGDLTQFTGSNLQAAPGADADLTRPSICANGAGYLLTRHETQAKTWFCSTGTTQATRVEDRNGMGFTFDIDTSGGDQVDVVSDYGNAPGNKVVFTGAFSSASQTDGTTTRSYTVGYDGVGNLTTVVDLRGKTTTFGYDASHNLTSVTTPGGNVTQVSYDSSHRVTSLTQDPSGVNAATALAYPSTGTTEVTDPDGNTTTYEVDFAARVTTVTDPYGASRSTSYTSDDQVSVAGNFNGSADSFSYTANTGPWGPESLTGVSNSTSGASVSLGYTSTGPTAYLPTTVTDEAQRSTALSYDGAGNLSGQSSGTTSTTVHHNSDGTVDYVQTAKGEQYHYHYANSGHLLTSVTPPVGNSLGTVSLSYDGFHRLTGRQDGRSGQSATMSYNPDDQLTAVSFLDGTHDIRYSYSADGSVVVRGDGTASTSWFYDELERLVATVSSAPPSSGVNPTRASAPSCPSDASATIVCYGYDAASNLTKVSTAEGNTRYSYSKTNAVDAILEPGGTLDLFGYNHDGKRVDSWLGATGTNAVFPPVYDATSVIKVPAAFAEHIHSTLTDDNRLSESVTSRNSSDTTKISDVSYGYADPAGHTTHERYSAEDAVTGRTATYVYDGLNRLTGVTGTAPNATFGYNLNGDVNNLDGTSFSFNSADQITANPAYAYDGAGNLVTSPAGSLGYNGAEQMRTAGTVSYLYTGLGQSELAQAGSTRFENSTIGVLASTTSAGPTYYTRDPDGQLVSLRTPTGTEYFPAFDGVGSVTALVNGGGAVSATYTYSPYGTLTASSGAASANPFRFVGGYQDPKTGYYHFGDRWYDPTTARWTQQDPATHLGDLTQGNPYAYAADNPVNNVDPSGHSCLSAGVLLFGAELLFGGTVLTAPETLGGTLLITGAAVVMIGSALDTLESCV